MSYRMRAPEIKTELDQSPESLLVLAQFAEVIANFRGATTALGLEEHPSLVEAATENPRSWYRDRMHSLVIYHADAKTLYADPPEGLDIYGDDDDDDDDFGRPPAGAMGPAPGMPGGPGGEDGGHPGGGDGANGGQGGD